MLPAGGALALFRFEIFSRSPLDLSRSLRRHSAFLLLGPPPVAEFEREPPAFFEQQTGSDGAAALPAPNEGGEELARVVAYRLDQELIKGIDRFLRDPSSRKQVHKVGSELLLLRNERCRRRVAVRQISTLCCLHAA